MTNHNCSVEEFHEFVKLNKWLLIKRTIHDKEITLPYDETYLTPTGLEVFVYIKSGVVKDISTKHVVYEGA